MASEPYPLTSAPADAPLDDEDDPDLRAAIEASLRDLPEVGAVPDYMPAADSSRQALALNRAPVDEPEDDAPLSAFMPAATIEDEDDRGPLSAAESENVQLFEALLMRIRDSGQDIRFDPQIQYLRESIQQLHPRITGAIESVDQKHTEFIKLHDRIVTAIKIYDQLLDKRLRSSTYIGASTAPPPQSLYPAVPAQQAAFVPSALPHYPPAATTAFYHQDRAIPAAYAAPPEQPAPVSPPQQTPPGMSTLAQHPGASTADLHMLPAGAYAVPPPVSHVPSIPVLQPAARQQVGSLAPPALAPSVQAPAPAPQPAPEPVQEPEEALLIEL
ncbi:Vacuolar protein-sorting-associated protein 27 [Coemansia helicoidea]|uniref:Vacuolar protein-sorting-associated protein 27 n=1 Tax=Coemansia helicoidea TaxID=1286919 RepID=A0ACC1LB49_9FUNG|nr:Vacuolar protein-sorting-associated protein 27 [Coemansia helicoidea]